MSGESATRPANTRPNRLPFLFQQRRKRAYYSRLIESRCGYEKAHDWQGELTQTVEEGEDVVLTLRTGGGKSTLFMAPILVAQERGEKKVGIIVVPTKALTLQQVCIHNTRWEP